jgi:hypothetical protein
MVQMVKSKRFEKEPVLVDGQYFFECHFNFTRLIYSGGELPSFQDCKFGEVEWLFQGAAGNTLLMMQVLNYIGFSEMVDGAIAEIKSPPDHPNVKPSKDLRGES